VGEFLLLSAATSALSWKDVLSSHTKTVCFPPIPQPCRPSLLRIHASLLLSSYIDFIFLDTQAPLCSLPGLPILFGMEKYLFTFLGDIPLNFFGERKKGYTLLLFMLGLTSLCRCPGSFTPMVAPPLFLGKASLFLGRRFQKASPPSFTPLFLNAVLRLRQVGSVFLFRCACTPTFSPPPCFFSSIKVVLCFLLLLCSRRPFCSAETQPPLPAQEFRGRPLSARPVYFFYTRSWPHAPRASCSRQLSYRLMRMKIFSTIEQTMISVLFFLCRGDVFFPSKAGCIDTYFPTTRRMRDAIFFPFVGITSYRR